eukprot:gene16988-biopygen7200
MYVWLTHPGTDLMTQAHSHDDSGACTHGRLVHSDYDPGHIHRGYSHGAARPVFSWRGSSSHGAARPVMVRLVQSWCGSSSHGAARAAAASRLASPPPPPPPQAGAGG